MGPSTPAELPGLGSSIAASIVSLGLVCLLAYVALRWLSRRTSGVSSSGGGVLRILARQSIDPRRSVVVVQAANRCFLVGAGEGPMTLLAELDQDVVNRDVALCRAPTTGGLEKRFGEVLARVLNRKRGTSVEPAPDDSPRSAAASGSVMASNPVTGSKSAMASREG